MLKDNLRVLGLSGHSTIASGGPPPISQADGCRLYYEIDTDILFLSLNAGPWNAIGGAAGASGWTDDGTNVRLTTTTDTVSIGTLVPIAGTKVVIEAPQLVTGGVDTTQGIDLTMVRTAALTAGELVTAIAVHPTGNALDDVASFITGLFLDAPFGTGHTSGIFVQGTAAVGGTWDEVILSNDNDIVILAQQQVVPAPSNIVLHSAGLAATSGEIRFEVSGIGATQVQGSCAEATGFEARSAWGRRAQIAITVAVNTNDLTAPTLATASAIVLANGSAADVDITGIVGGWPGRRITVVNGSDVAAETFTFTHEDAASAAANRFHNEDLASIILPRGSSLELMYDGTLSRWRPLYTGR